MPPKAIFPRSSTRFRQQPRSHFIREYILFPEKAFPRCSSSDSSRTRKLRLVNTVPEVRACIIDTVFIRYSRECGIKPIVLRDFRGNAVTVPVVFPSNINGQGARNNQRDVVVCTNATAGYLQIQIQELCSITCPLLTRLNAASISVFNLSSCVINATYSVLHVHVRMNMHCLIYIYRI